MKILRLLFTFFALSIFLFSCEEEGIDENLDSPFESFKEEALINSLNARIRAKGSDDKSDYQSTVYTLSNEVEGNRILVYTRNGDGTIMPSGSFDTGGTGSGSELGNQSAITLSKSGKLLFAVNPGSDEFSFFYVHKDGSLNLMQTVSSNGVRPVSITYRHGLVYVVNAGGSGNISGFAFNKDGEIENIPNSIRPLSQPMSAPAQISFSSNGKALIDTEKATQIISSYVVNNDGSAGSLKTFTSATPTPFGFVFTNSNLFYVSEAAGATPGASTISTYKVDNAANVSLESGPFRDGQTAVC